jgi:hypothetical protein
MKKKAKNSGHEGMLETETPIGDVYEKLLIRRFPTRQFYHWAGCKWPVSRSRLGRKGLFGTNAA